MGLTEDAWAVSNALVYAGDTNDMFLIIGARAGDEFWSAAKNGLDAVAKW